MFKIEFFIYMALKFIYKFFLSDKDKISLDNFWSDCYLHDD